MFALLYLQNGRNATAAYLEAYPKVKSSDVARAAGARLLANVSVREFVEKRTTKVLEELEYSGDQALRDISRQAQADIRRLFDKEGNLLPVHEWPDDIADAVKTIQPTPFGIKVGLADKLAARITIAKAAGKFTKKHEIKGHVTYGQLLGDGPLPEE